MRWQHMTPAEARRMPWKNGLGLTLELAVEPPGATLETGFHWRLSSAEVATSGPFSSFPGLERWLLLLEGAGFRIDFGERGCVLLDEPRVPLRFSGDWPATATLLEGPCIDLNLMVDPGCCRASLQVLHADAELPLPLAPGTHLVFIAAGSLAVPLWNLHLETSHLLRVEDGPAELTLVPDSDGASLVWIHLEHL
jgi:uncharacterized protein